MPWIVTHIKGLMLLAGALFAALKWQATQLYARGVVELVLWQMGG